MTTSLPERVWHVLACPDCGGPLERDGAVVRCARCAEVYGYNSAGQLDLRPRRRRQQEVTFDLGSTLQPDAGIDFARLARNPAPEVDFTGVPAPKHLDTDTLSHFPRARTQESLALDLGCGDGIHREICEHAGFVYVPVDSQGGGAQLLGDAHALPFRNESFEFALSVAVLEHIRYPFLMAKELFRVLRPSGKVIGTVAFLERYHGQSLYHHTHLGVYNTLAFAGFRIERIAPSKSWSILSAPATLALFPRLPKAVCKALVLPVTLLHQAWWLLRRLASRDERWSEQQRILAVTGDFTFIARKV